MRTYERKATKIKLCGLSRREDILLANELRPDYIGFVFFEKSKRYVNYGDAQRLKEGLGTGIGAVGVFVNEDMERILALFNGGVIDLAQLHGDESPEYILRLKERSGKELIQAFRVKDEADLKRAAESPADYVLLDSGYGGGVPLDWGMLKGFKRPYFLAGGLNISNVREAIGALSPYGVDVSSGIESGGKKDAEKMRRFVELVRQ